MDGDLVEDGDQVAQADGGQEAVGEDLDDGEVSSSTFHSILKQLYSIPISLFTTNISFHYKYLSLL